MMVQGLLQRAALGEPYELLLEDVAKDNFGFRTEWVPPRRNQNKAVFRKWKRLEFLGRVDRLRDDPDVAWTLGEWRG